MVGKVANKTEMRAIVAHRDMMAEKKPDRACNVGTTADKTENI